MGKLFMPGMILDELADAVGGYENVSMEMSDRATYGVDYFCWARGRIAAKCPPCPTGSCVPALPKKFPRS